jgi:pimeloyl-ACP methyl ester carboxylesterase
MLKLILRLFALAAAATVTLLGQDIVGDWRGTLKPGGQELRVALHFAKDGSGYKGTFDSLDQGVTGIPLSSITLEDSKVGFKVDSAQGSYAGKVTAAGNTIEGEWTQGASLPLNFERGKFVVKEHKPAKPSDIDGIWQGALDVGVTKLRLAFHISNTEDGLIATLDSIDQEAHGIPVTRVVRTGSAIKMEVNAIGGVFEGKIAPDLSGMEGTWTQGGNGIPLALKRVKEAAVLDRKRPQNPVKPYPYREEEVVFQNKPAGIKLAATLTLPKGTGPFPAVMLITGSGQQDRDESLLGHRPFLVLSDYLTRKGIVVLRADDRGMGGSTGNFATSTTADFATDIEAGIAYLKTRPEVRKIGLIGHSEGGVIAPMVAARNADVAFIVMMAGTGVPGDAILVAQQSLIASAMGLPKDTVEAGAVKQRKLFALVEREKDNEALAQKAKEQFAEAIPQDQLRAQLKVYGTPWFRYFLDYDPALALSKLKCPVLAINGKKDLQVPPSLNLPAIRKALRTNPDVEIAELPGLNHLFQTAKTGAPIEYAEIEETISPVALEKMAAWVLKH